MTENLFSPLTDEEKAFSLSSIPVMGNTSHSLKNEDWQPWNYPPQGTLSGQEGEKLPYPLPDPWRGYEFKAWYAYEDEDGQVLYFVVRMEDQAGHKVTPALSYGGLDGKEGWHWKKPDQRVLFNLPELALLQDKETFPNDKILVVEGEKTAIAAQKRLPAYTVTTSGGSTSAGLVNWEALRGHEVLIWPDNDEAGFKYAEEVKKKAYQAGALKVFISAIPEHYPKGWDLADPIPVRPSPIQEAA
ncbi:hypothetical protein FAI40_03025 [Acetobacteraceae bacterium]|nr:hypothetical protein FAI40_03025 [Acetobacteraceae bacterium]